jgi:hypothetical protein
VSDDWLSGKCDVQELKLNDGAKYVANFGFE